MGDLSVWHWIVVVLVVALPILIYFSVRNAKRRRDAIAAGTAPRPYGFGGWLAFYCILTVVFLPLRGLAAIAENIRALDVLPGSAHRMRYMLISDIAVTLGFVTLGVWAAVALWRLRPDAVERNKIYLLASLIMAAVWPFVALAIANLPSDLQTDTHQLVSGVIGGAIYYLIWSSYFKRSERIRNTFGVGDRADVREQKVA